MAVPTGVATMAVGSADGGWGALPDPLLAFHVRADGDDANAGTASAPVATIEAGMATAEMMTAR
ncbi:MAG: hypothetical protein AAB369_05270, partial [Chloroflexota bacterium]